MERARFNIPKPAGYKPTEKPKLTGCEACLSEKKNGTWHAAEYTYPDGTTAEDVVVCCPKRYDCEKIVEFREKWIRHITAVCGLPADLLTKSGKTFTTEKPWQKKAVAMITERIKADDSRWIYISGQSGCGKTHLGSAVVNSWIRKGRPVKYMRWLDIMRDVKAFKQHQLAQAKTAQILFLDDLYKIDPTKEELRATYELIDYRYTHDLITVITTERTPEEMVAIDEAVIGRIIEKCGKSWINVPREKNDNHRLREFLK